MFKFIFTLLLLVIPTLSFAGSKVIGDLYVSGNVGVGSANPTAALDIAGGTLKAGGIATTQINNPSTVYDVLQSGDTDYWQGVSNNLDGIDNDTFQIGTGTTQFTNPRFVLDKNGNVGIGTGTISGQTAQLYILSSNVTPSGIILASSGGSSLQRLQIYPTGNLSVVFKRVNASGIFQFQSSAGITNLQIDGSNNVSVNTTATTAKLTIQGGGASTGKMVEMLDSAVTPRFTVLDNGNIGIGSTQPTGILSIPSIKATSGTRYLCIDSVGVVSSSASPCSGT
jgi:hypothetical protein